MSIDIEKIVRDAHQAHERVKAKAETDYVEWRSSMIVQLAMAATPAEVQDVLNGALGAAFHAGHMYGAVACLSEVERRLSDTLKAHAMQATGPLQ